jgi:hypothetical protein
MPTGPHATAETGIEPAGPCNPDGFRNRSRPYEYSANTNGVGETRTLYLLTASQMFSQVNYDPMFVKSGDAENRTRGLCRAKATLSQLSYIPA